MSVRIDGLRDVQRALQKLAKDEIPTAMRNAINDTARDITKRLNDETKRVLDAPKGPTAAPFYVAGNNLATKQNLTATIRIKDKFATKSNPRWLEHVITQHIPGYPKTRNHKGFEHHLINKGYMKPNQYLVPARTLRRDRYGNPSPGIYANILNDLAVFRGREGFTSTTKAANRKYAWLTLRKGKWQREGAVTGIWYINKLRKGQLPALVFLAVTKRPTYSPRLRALQVAESWFRKVAPKHAQLAVSHAIARRSR